MHETMTPATRAKVQKSHGRPRPAGVNWGDIKNWLGRLLP
jgi:hypothetical protein